MCFVYEKELSLIVVVVWLLVIEKVFPWWMEIVLNKEE